MLSTEIGLVVFTGTIVIVLLILGIVIFIIRYNNRLLKLELTRQKQLIEAEIQSKESERIRIAREIHDSLSSNLTLVNILIQQAGPKLHEEELLKIKEALETTHQSIRNVSKDLLAHDIDVYGLTHAVNEFIDNARIAGSHFTVISKGEENRLQVHQKVAVFRIIQEILSNAIKHSQCKKFHTELNYENEHLAITIEFDGKIFDHHHETQKSKGMGLKNIESRVQYLKARLDYNNSVNSNFYKINIPLDERD